MLRERTDQIIPRRPTHQGGVWRSTGMQGLSVLISCLFGIAFAPQTVAAEELTLNEQIMRLGLPAIETLTDSV